MEFRGKFSDASVGGEFGGRVELVHSLSNDRQGEFSREIPIVVLVGLVGLVFSKLTLGALNEEACLLKDGAKVVRTFRVLQIFSQKNDEKVHFWGLWAEK